MDAMNAMNAMNGRAPDAYPPWRAAPDGHPPGRESPPPAPPDPDDHLLAAMAEADDGRRAGGVAGAADAARAGAARRDRGGVGVGDAAVHGVHPDRRVAGAGPGAVADGGRRGRNAMDAMHAMNAMNGRAPDGYPPWRAAPDGHPPGRESPPPASPGPDDALLAAIAETVREVRTLDATIAAADADLARLPTLLAWLVRVRHPVLWLICVPRHEAAAALAAPSHAAAAAPPHGRRRIGLRPALLLALLALLALALLALALLAPALLGASGMAMLGEAVR
jgi:hypothetical protein